MDVVVWLRSLGLERYEAVFRENEITERVLPSLTQEDLKEIGVGPVGHRRIILEAIAARRSHSRRSTRMESMPSSHTRIELMSDVANDLIEHSTRTF